MTIRKSIPLLLGFALLAGFVLAGVSGADPAASNVVVVVNANDPDSLAIGRYYAERRGIPKGNIIELDAPTEETISLREYVERVHNPLLNKLLDKEWVRGVKAGDPEPDGRERLLAVVHRIRFLVTVRGIPLRFENDPALLEGAPETIPAALRHNRGSVDSELALLLGLPGMGMTAFVPNPWFEKEAISSGDAQRLIKISRLDGPRKEDVLRLIDRSLQAEAEGLMGRAYIDSGGLHAKGDTWFEAARDLAQAAFFDTDFEGTKRMMGFEDRLDAPAIYMGWYRNHAYGPWRQARWSVPPGAIGFHLHSFSATTVRSADDGWLGPLVRQGYCATFGNVYEPYLDYTHRPQVVLRQLLAGGYFGDAIMQANPVLSWQTVAIGDPLYRPFKRDLAAQIAEPSNSPYAGYSALRRMNQLVAGGDRAAALAEGRARFGESPSLALALELSKLFEAEEQPREALAVLQFIRYLNVFSLDEMALVQRIAERLTQLGDSELAIELFQRMLATRNLPKGLRQVLLERGAIVAGDVGRTELVSLWALEAQQLKAK